MTKYAVTLKSKAWTTWCVIVEAHNSSMAEDIALKEDKKWRKKTGQPPAEDIGVDRVEKL